MTTDLRLWLSADLGGPWIWWQSPTTYGEVTTDSEKAGVRALEYKTLTVILSGQCVRTYDHDLPEMRAAERQKAATIFIEDQLASAGRKQHLVVNGDGQIMVISQTVMEEVQSRLHGFGLRPQKIVTDFQAVPLAFGCTLLPDRMISPGARGYTVDTDWMSYTPNGSVETPTSRDVYSLISELDVQSATNLSVGAFAPKQALVPGLSTFSRAAMLFGVFCLSGLIWQGAQWRAFSTQAKALETETAALYKAATGKTAANPALEVTRAVKSQKKPGGSFLELSSVLFSNVAKIGGIEIDRVQYDKNANALNLRIFYPDFDAVSGLEKEIAKNGGTFASGGVREQSGRRIGEARLTLGGGS